MLNKGLFIVIDGIDGCGSTTHSILLFDYLKSRMFKVKLTKEPTNSMIGVITRKMLRFNEIPPIIDALLFSADRQLHSVEISKDLEKGYIVICDRYLESTIAYQSSQGLDEKWLLSLNKSIVQPDITFILDIEPKIALIRKELTNPEKFENVEFLEKVRQKFIERIHKNKYIKIYSDKNKENIQSDIRIYVDIKLNNRM